MKGDPYRSPFTLNGRRNSIVGIRSSAKSRGNVDDIKTAQLSHDEMSMPILFQYGFRVFFFAAAIDAVAIAALWLIALICGLDILPLQGAIWHAHEMLFGFTAAAIAGFLLTAVPNWTGIERTHGARLVLLAGLWLAGRLALAPWSPVPAWLAALIDVSFFPALAATLAAPLVRIGKWRNIAFLPLLLLLALANLLVHLERLGIAQSTASLGLAFAMNIVMLLVAIVGGRIVPAFTRNAVAWKTPDDAPKSFALLEKAALLLIVALALIELTPLPDWIVGSVAAFAALAHGMRLWFWRGFATRSKPILWILHVGYLWLVIGLALKAIWLLTYLPFADAWRHVIGMGAFATMILAVMTRASLGHTGRPLVVTRLTVVAYWSLIMAVLARAAAIALPFWYNTALAVAGTLWIMAFTFFLFVYWPILTRPRADGRPG